MGSEPTAEDSLRELREVGFKPDTVAVAIVKREMARTAAAEARAANAEAELAAVRAGRDAMRVLADDALNAFREAVNDPEVRTAVWPTLTFDMLVRRRTELLDAAAAPTAGETGAENA